jgi:hypothetical protein
MQVIARRVVAASVLCIAAMFVTGTKALHAQVLSGAVVDRETGRSVSAAAVLLLGERDSVLARGLTDVAGRFALVSPEGTRAIRVLRIGYTPVSVTAPTVSRDRPLRIELERLATLLSGVQTTAQSSCRSSPSRTTAYALFQQIRLALLASVIASDSARDEAMAVVRFVRFLDGRSDRATSQDVTIDTLEQAMRPFRSARTLQRFADSGFTSGEGPERVFYAPDAEVLFAEGFPAVFCLDMIVGRDQRENQAGVRFQRARGRAGRTDIEGEVWIDTLSRTLKELNFRYVGLPSATSKFRPGGRVEFVELPNGTVVVNRWALRLVAMQIDSLRIDRERFDQVASYEVQETGGELASVRFPDKSRWTAPMGAVLIAPQWSEGAEKRVGDIGLERTNFRAKREALDTLLIEYLPPGPYRVVVRDTELSRIGIELNTGVTFTATRGDTTRVSFRVPTALDYARSLCSTEPQGSTMPRFDPDKQSVTTISRPAAGRAAFFVLVVDRSGAPIANAAVTEALSDRNGVPAYRSDGFGGKTDAGGRYFSCWRFGIGESVQLWVRPPGQAPQLTTVVLERKVNAVLVRVPSNAGGR